MSTPPESAGLYDRIGDAALAEVVDRFYRRVLDDPQIGPYFASASMARLTRMQKEFFAAALGAPTTYSGLGLQEAHGRLGVTRSDFSRFVEHLADTLGELQVDHEVVDALMARLALSVDDIVGGHGEDG